MYPPVCNKAKALTFIHDVTPSILCRCNRVTVGPQLPPGSLDTSPADRRATTRDEQPFTLTFTLQFRGAAVFGVLEEPGEPTQTRGATC